MLDRERGRWVSDTRLPAVPTVRTNCAGCPNDAHQADADHRWQLQPLVDECDGAFRESGRLRMPGRVVIRKNAKSRRSPPPSCPGVSSSQQRAARDAANRIDGVISRLASTRIISSFKFPGDRLIVDASASGARGQVMPGVPPSATGSRRYGALGAVSARRPRRSAVQHLPKRLSLRRARSWISGDIGLQRHRGAHVRIIASTRRRHGIKPVGGRERDRMTNILQDLRFGWRCMA
jgi:hypothetical protein